MSHQNWLKSAPASGSYRNYTIDFNENRIKATVSSFWKHNPTLLINCI